MSNDFDQNPEQQGYTPAPGSQDSGWETVGGPVPSARQSAPEQQRRTARMRVAVVVASLIATVGAVVFGFAITSGHGSKASNSAAGAPNVAVDPPSSAASGVSQGAGSPTALPTLPGVPVAPTPDAAGALASAQAAMKAFVPPTSVPANVPGYSGSAPLNAVSLPPFLAVSVPSVQAQDSKGQLLADQSELLLKAWAEAWATGNTNDVRYRTLCVEQCKVVLDPTITLWRRADIVPAGSLQFFNLAGGVAKISDQSGEVGVCLDDSALTAFQGGTTYQNPYSLGQPELLVFGLVFDKVVGHWVATEAYTSPGDSYCAQDNGSGGGTSS